MTNIRKYWLVVPLALSAALGIVIRGSAPTSVQAAPATIVLARDADNPAHHPFARQVTCMHDVEELRGAIPRLTPVHNRGDMLL